MFGAGGGGSGQTQSSDLVSHENKVVAAVKPVLVDSIVYKDIHKAGIDLNQARADYRALLSKLVDEKPAAGSGGIASSLMSQATSLPSTLMGGAAAAGGAGGGVAGTLSSVVSFTQGVAFKAQDIKAKFFFLTALQQEPQIEAASNEMTYQGINQTMNPFFPLWFDPAPAKDADKWAGPDDPLDSLGGNMFGAAKGLVQKKDDDVRSSIADRGNDVKGFFEKAPDNPPPGTEAMGMAFNDPPKHQGAKTIIPMKMGDVACQAFIKALSLPPQLGFAETVVSGIMGVSLEFTMSVYQALLVRDATKTIAEEDLVKSASEDLKLAERLEAIALDKLSFLKKAKEWDTSSLTTGLPLLSKGYKVDPGELADKEADKLDELIAEKVSPLLKPIIEYAMTDLATMLEDSRACGVSDKCHTMEWYLGKLPMIQATLFCNLFFPFWSAMMRAGADLVGGPVGSAIKGILDVSDKMKGAVDTARGVVTKVGAYAKAADDTATSLQSFNQSNVASKAASDYQAFDQAGKKKADDITTKSPAAQQTLADYPLKGRSDMGQGVKISSAGYDAVKTDFKWGDAKDPAGSDDDASKDGAGATGSAGASAVASK